MRELDLAAEGYGNTQQEAAAAASTQLIERYCNKNPRVEPSQKMSWHDLSFYIYQNGEAK